MAAMARLNRILQCNTIGFASQLTLYKSLVTSIFLYSCKTWTLLADSEKREPVFEIKCVRKLLPNWTTRQMTGCGARSTACGSTGTSSGNCQETETRMVRACHTSRQPLQHHPSRHLGGWATPWSAEEVLGGKHQRVDIPVHARTAHNGLMHTHTKNGRGSLLNHLLYSPERPNRSSD